MRMRRERRESSWRSLIGLGVALAASAMIAVWAAPPLATTGNYDTVVEEFDLVAPSGNRLYGLIRRPDPTQYPDAKFPAVVLVPGGVGAGRLDAFRPETVTLAQAGMVVASFNAEGRVDVEKPEDIRSEGSEDHNGFRNQDGLAKVIEYVMALDCVIPENVGVWSGSFGITMAAGCLGRYPDLGVKYLVDGEGPSESFVTAHGPRYLAGEERPGVTGGVQFGHRALWEDSSPENVEWWSEREAVRFIGAFRGEYLRLQATWDHAQPPDEVAGIA